MKSSKQVPLSLAETWLLNNRVNLVLLNALSAEQLACAPSSRERSVAEQLAHVHNVRVRWLGPRTAKAGLLQIEKGNATKAHLAGCLNASAKAIGEAFAAAEASGSVKGFKRGPAAFVAYFISHEAHHRGQILVHLKRAGMPVPRQVALGLWNWATL